MENRILAIKGTITLILNWKDLNLVYYFPINVVMFKKSINCRRFRQYQHCCCTGAWVTSIEVIQHSKYCDDAFTSKSSDNDPYDLLISDLSFKNRSSWKTDLTCGDELIEAVKKVQPIIKTIVFLNRDKSYRIKSLFNNLGLMPMFQKEETVPELQNAVETIYRKRWESDCVTYTTNDKSLHEIGLYISLKLLSKRIHPRRNFKRIQKYGNNTNGSSIEKRINKLKIYFKANNVHLIAMLKI
jgi:hypothetical protein